MPVVADPHQFAEESMVNVSPGQTTGVPEHGPKLIKPLATPLISAVPETARDIVEVPDVLWMWT